MHRYNIYNKYFITKLTTPEQLDKKQHCKQKKMHVLIQLNNNNWFTKKNKYMLTYQINSWYIKCNQYIQNKIKNKLFMKVINYACFKPE